MKLRVEDRETALPPPRSGQVRTAEPIGLVGRLLTMQRSAGNRAVSHLVRSTSTHGPSLQREGDEAAVADEAPGALLEKQEVVEPSAETGGEAADSGTEMAAVLTAEVGDFPTGNPDEVAAAPPAATGFVDGGRVGTAPWGDESQAHGAGCAHAFTAGGMSGTTPWGPAGAHNVQGVGTIQAEVPPTYQAQPAAPPVAALAWVQNGTGKIQVTRAYIGVNAGNQGNGYFVTAAAAARINQHEVGHVNSTRGFHDADLKPMLDQILTYTQAQAGRGAAVDQPGAIATLQATLGMPARWAASKASFTAHDTATNSPMGPFDVADKASGTYPVDAGPGIVGGTAFAHRIKTPGEPAPV
jgi:hypothetical protein